MNNVIQKASVLNMEDNLLKGYAPQNNKLLLSSWPSSYSNSHFGDGRLE